MKSLWQLRPKDLAQPTVRDKLVNFIGKPGSLDRYYFSPKEEDRPTPELAWLAIVAGSIELQRLKRTEPLKHAEASRNDPRAIVNAFASLVSTIDPATPTNEHCDVLWRVNRNRRIRSAVNLSGPDAAAISSTVIGSESPFKAAGRSTAPGST